MSTPAEEIWAILREVAETQKETALEFKETERRFKETDKKIKEVTANIGRLGNRLGEFIEDAVRPAAAIVPAVLVLAGIHRVIPVSVAILINSRSRSVVATSSR